MQAMIQNSSKSVSKQEPKVVPHRPKTDTDTPKTSQDMPKGARDAKNDKVTGMQLKSLYKHAKTIESFG